MNDIKNYIERTKAKRKTKVLFINLYHNADSGKDFNQHLKYMVEQAGIDKVITLHCLRHSCATHLLDSGLKVEEVGIFLGHSFLTTTQIYTRIGSKL
jgi:integrase/recombinase XerD